MKHFKITAAQGELNFRRIGPVPKRKGTPKGYTMMKPEGSRLIIGHSETGHHHIIDAQHASVSVLARAPEGMRILRMIVESPTPIVHLRDHDTHEPIMFEPGEYEVRIGREFDPYAEIARRQAD